MNDAPGSLDSDFEYIVIGSGSAGSAVAGRLAADGHSRVLVLEAGGSDRRLPVMMPAATYLKAIGNPRYDWRWSAARDPTRGGRSDYMPRGKVLGGSSSINGMLYVRGQAEDFDDWAAGGCLGWDFASVLPYFRRAEDNENGSDLFHGIGGPVSVSNLRVSHPLSAAFVASSIKAGLPLQKDLNRPPQDGVGYVQATQRKGWRCNAFHAYLRPLLGRANLRVLTGAHVRRILTDGRRAIGVEFDHQGRTAHVAARKIILSAGALASPQILLLSGIGPADHLQDLGIPVIHHLPGVGRNLQDHPGTSHVTWVNRPTYNVQVRFWHYLSFGARWLIFGSGPGSTPDAHVLAFTRSDPQLARCDIQYHFTPAGYDLDERGPILFDRPAVTALNNLHRPKSRGWVRLRSGNPYDPPEIQPNLVADPEDVEKLIIGAKFLRSIFETQPLADYVTGELKPGRDVRSDDEWRDFIRETAIGIYHPAGSCRMGHGPNAVVDDCLKVHGMSGLYIADASIMPLIVSGNLNANCMMIGEKCADMLRSSTKNGSTHE